MQGLGAQIERLLHGFNSIQAIGGKNPQCPISIDHPNAGLI